MAAGETDQPSVTNAAVGPRTTRSRLATRWNAVTTAGISTGLKVSVSMTIGRSIVSPTFLPRSGSLHLLYPKAARRCAILEPASGLPGPCIEKINTLFSVTTIA
jgi:hypothetical protein